MEDGLWRREALGKYMDFSNGKSSPERATSGSYPVFGSNGLIGWSDQYNAPAGTTVIGRVGSYCGSTHYAVVQCWVTDNAIKATAKNPSEHRFWNYALENQNLHTLRSGSGQPLINQTSLKAVELMVPPADQRVPIGDLLGSLDDKIDLNRQINQTLEALARAVFEDWFVAFGPTRRKMAGEIDPAAILGGLLPPKAAAPIAPLFPDEFGENGLPLGWKEKSIGQMLEDVIGGDWGKDVSTDLETERMAVVRGTDFLEIKNGGSGKVPVRFSTEKKVSRRKLQPFDILVEVSGGSPTQPTGRSILVTKSILERFMAPVVPASFCRRFRPANKEIAMLLHVHLSKLYDDGGTWKYQNQSTGISNFQTTHFLDSEMVIDAGTEIIQKFSHFMEPIVELTSSNENLTLAATRDLLLPKLMSGELRLLDVESGV